MKKLVALLFVLAVLAACSTPTPEVIEKEVIVEKEVPVTVVVEKEVIVKEKVVETVEVEKEVVVEVEKIVEVTAVPVVSKYNEAPMLAGLVATGELPPVDERLPKDVQVIDVYESIGQYGGIWHTITWNASDPGNIKMKLYDPPWRWKPDYSGYESGLAKSFEMNDACTELTWHFREGIKWSDGEPFIPKVDFGFWWNDLVLDEDFKVVTVPWYLFQADGSTPMDVEFPDDYTMVWKNFKPNCIAPYIVAQGFWEFEPLITPKHYLSQFHPKYNSDVTDYEDLEQKRKWVENPAFPVLFAWHVESFTAGARTVFVRNPYYWKVDSEGNQLPYIDRIDVAEIPDKEVRVLELSTGRYEASFRGTDDPNDIPFLLEQAEGSGYHLQEGWMNGAGGWPMFIINQDYVPDEEIRDLLRNTTFRKGLSVAMNRERLIDVVWGGIGTPQQSTISPQAWHFASPEGQALFEEWQQSDAQYDPGLAESYFDEIGFVDADGDGWRDLPSGDELTLRIDCTASGLESHGQVVELAKEGWEAVGLRTQVNAVPDEQMNVMSDSSEIDIRGCWGLGDGPNFLVFPNWVVPVDNDRWAPLYGAWYKTLGTDKEGTELDLDPLDRNPPREEPPEGNPVWKLWELYDAARVEPDDQKRLELSQAIAQVHIDEGPFVIGTVANTPTFFSYLDYVGNIPTQEQLGLGGFTGPWIMVYFGAVYPEQFYYKNIE